MEHESDRHRSPILWLDGDPFFLPAREDGEGEDDASFLLYVEVRDRECRVRRIARLKLKDRDRQGPTA